MIEPLRHAPGLADLTTDEVQAVSLLMGRLSQALHEVLQAKHVYAFILEDPIPHLHLHLIARHPGAPSQYWGHVTECPRHHEAERLTSPRSMCACVSPSLTDGQA
jgi:diadenosine tetraphosphate (Ap4A) HIT family hydrolase